ncbi:MAG: hypothetical protein FWC78_06955 [Defluviitaleaceae bacterium]|nr:hypothetical protein [Defluviitaleaceae bacterium]
MNENNKEYETHDDEELMLGKRYRFNFESGLYPLALLIYLVLGFMFGLWHPGWLVFVGAWLVEELIEWQRTGKPTISIYTVAAVVFLLVGFFGDGWRFAWLVFVAAWVIDEMFVPEKKMKKKDKKRTKKEAAEREEASEWDDRRN